MSLQWVRIEGMVYKRKRNNLVVSEPGQSIYAQGAEGEHSLPLRDIIHIIRKRFWVIVLVVLVFTGAALGYSLVHTPTYEATVTMLVGQRQEAEGLSNLGSNVQGLQELTKTMTAAGNSRPIAEDVIEQLNLQIAPEQLLENLRVEQIAETQLITVSYKAPTPDGAQQVANATGGEFSEQVSKVSPDVNSVTVTVWEPAAVPDEPVGPNLTLNVLLALVLSVAVGLGLVFLLEYFDDSWRWPEEVERTSSGEPEPNFDVVFSSTSLKGGEKAEP